MPFKKLMQSYRVGGWKHWADDCPELLKDVKSLMQKLSEDFPNREFRHVKLDCGNIILSRMKGAKWLEQNGDLQEINVIDLQNGKTLNDLVPE